MPWSSKWSLSFRLSHQNPAHISLFSHACHMPCHLILLALICLMLFGKEYNLCSPSSCSFFRSAVTSSLLGQDILLRTLFSNTLSLCSSLNVRYQVSHPYKATATIMVLYILTFIFLESRQEHKSL
jgi:hypothetical protein